MAEKKQPPGIWGYLIGMIGQLLGVMERTVDGGFKATSPHAGVLAVAALAAFIVVGLGGIIIVGGLFAGLENSLYLGAGLAAIGVIVLLVPMFLLRPVRTPPQTIAVSARPGNASETKGRVRWYRHAVSRSDVTSQRFKLHEALQSLRRQAQQEYASMLERRKPKTKLEEISVARVRINVFLPDVDAGEENLQVCVLSIPDQLSDGMSERAEREITFWPGQGLTGLVFVSGRAFGAVWPGGKEMWKRVFVAGKPGTDEAAKKFFISPRSRLAELTKRFVGSLASHCCFRTR